MTPTTTIAIAIIITTTSTRKSYKISVDVDVDVAGAKRCFWCCCRTGWLQGARGYKQTVIDIYIYIKCVCAHLLRIHAVNCIVQPHKCSKCCACAIESVASLQVLRADRSRWARNVEIRFQNVHHWWTDQNGNDDDVYIYVHAFKHCLCLQKDSAADEDAVGSQLADGDGDGVGADIHT